MRGQYGISRSVDLSYEQALERVTEALKTEGFGVLTEIDLKATIRKKLGADFRRYVILGVCNPPFAFKALSAELEIGLLLPCNVIVYEADQGGAVVAALNPMVAMSVVDNPELAEVAQEVTVRLQRALASL